MRRVPGSHEPNNKNRSSKHLVPLTKIKPVFKSMSNAALAEFACEGAKKERARRNKKNGVKTTKETK